MSKRRSSRGEPLPEGYCEEITVTKEVIRRHPYEPKNESTSRSEQPRRSSGKGESSKKRPSSHQKAHRHADPVAIQEKPHREEKPRRHSKESAPFNRAPRKSVEKGIQTESRPSHAESKRSVDSYRPSSHRAPPARSNDVTSRSSVSQPRRNFDPRGQPSQPQRRTPHNSYPPSAPSESTIRAPPPRPPRLSAFDEPSDSRRGSPSYHNMSRPSYADDYLSPVRNDRGRYSYNQPSAQYDELSQSQGGGTFRIRIHRADGVFSEMEDGVRRKVLPSTYIAVHTSTERGHSGVVENELNPVFNDEFFFHSANPEQDALVCTLVSLNPYAARDKKVSECVISLKNTMWGVEREVWVPMVRHPGTPYAYERGELLVSIFSEDYGVDDLPTEEEEAYFSEEVQRILLNYAPEELHKLDWLVGEYLSQGDDGLDILLSKYRRRASIRDTRHNASSVSQPAAIADRPYNKGNGDSLVVYNPNTSSAQRGSVFANQDAAKVRVTVLDVKGLVDVDGSPTTAESCYITISNGRDEHTSRIVPYQRRAVFNQDFRLSVANPDQDAIHITVFAGGKKTAEVDVALTNVEAGQEKDVTLMLVRAAETGDAANGGEIHLTLKTDEFSSLNKLTPEAEKDTRERVLVYLWNYLRDELHRVDPVVASIDDVEMYMQEWSRAIGPELPLRHLSVSVKQCNDILPANSSGLPHRCFVRVSSGPFVTRTELAQVRHGGASFSSKIPIGVCDPQYDSLEIMLVEETEATEVEISRVVLSLSDLPKQSPVTKTVPLVVNAGTRLAKVQGSVNLELVAEDFGSKNGGAGEASAAPTSTNPETLHRVGFNQKEQSVNPGRRDDSAADPSRRRSTGVSAAKGGPMSVKVLGLKEFVPGCDFYAKVYLNGEPILRTKDYSGGGSACVLGIADNNEANVRLHDAAEGVLTVKVFRRRGVRKTVLGQTEIALGGLICGERNTLWVPLSTETKEAKPESAKKERRSSKAKTPEAGEELQKIKHNRMPVPTSNPEGQGALITMNGDSSSVGLLGIELQSIAFPVTDVPLYDKKRADQSSPVAPRGNSASSPEDVTADVTSLLAKFKPTEVGKVQPMIAQCSSARQAHSEIRSKVAPRGIEATFYVDIVQVEMNSDEGRKVEQDSGLSVEVAYNGERQVSAKQGKQYSRVRLDVAPPMGKVNHALTLTLRGGRGGAAPRNSTTFVSGNPDFSTSPKKSPKKRRDSQPMGGVNNLASYMDTTDIEVEHPKLSAADFNHLSTGFVGEIGDVQLSMRAFLSEPLHKLGDTISVPVVRPGAGAKSKESIVGQITFRVSTPAFEQVPHWAKLASESILSEVEPAYVHYYVKRIGAYLREYNPNDLRTFHLQIFERDVASGRWYVSLKDYFNTLVKRYGPEVRRFPPEPPLPFDPLQREQEEAAAAARYGDTYQDVFNDSEQGDGLTVATSEGYRGSTGGLKRSEGNRRSRKEKKPEKEADFGF
ncbi:C2 domain containing protein, putative [Angomonas deanei]|uniref:C2 domain containing protein, putative n=1 Tax=Angomonas deanei TaxID=59799 RepID=A0A7G2C520_9TRYP|nr:C2 domain containing protein, putative [Angomonas deanei]